MGRPKHLPDYDRPPVDEVVVGVQFAALTRFRPHHMGLFWEQVRARYPRLSEQNALVPVYETFGGIPGKPNSFQFELVSAETAFPRYWLEEENGPCLLQIQQDRLHFNWRKFKTDQPYPHFEVIEKKFVEDMSVFLDFIKRMDLGDFAPTQCEVTYVNPIRLPNEDDPHRMIGTVSSLLNNEFHEPTGIELESLFLTAKFVKTTEDGQKFLRTHVTFRPFFQSQDMSPFIQLEITSRGKPSKPTLEACIGLIREERETVVTTFDAVTTDTMHKIWGRKND